jgi:type II secretory pathway component PulK
MQRNATLSGRLVRTASRGVTITKVLIVVAIVSLIAAGVTVAVLPRFRHGPPESPTTTARALRNAVNQWRATRGGDECPTISRLIQDNAIDSAAKVTDPWAQPYKIQCSRDDTTVSSAGPDKKENTEDDIVVPLRAGDRF